MSRSHLMARSKQQLKDELLRNFQKKAKKTTQKQSKSMKSEVSSQRQDETLIDNQYKGSMSYYNNHRSVLDQFTKFPVQDEEEDCLYNGEMFLNNFMFKKDRPVFQKAKKMPNSMQAKNKIKIDRSIRHPKSEFQAKTVSVKISPLLKEQPKVSDFNNSAYHNHKIQTQVRNIKNESIKIPKVSNNGQSNNGISNNDKHIQVNQSDDSAEQLLRQMNKGKQIEQSQPSFGSLRDYEESYSIEKVESEIENDDKKNERNQNENSKHNKDIQKRLEQKKQFFQTNSNKLKEMNEKSLPQIAIGKQVKPRKQHSQPQIPIKDSKIVKKLEGNEKKNETQNKKKPSSDSKIENQKEEDPFDWLAPYESSESALQAVIEQENESQLTESVKSKLKQNNFQKQKHWSDEYKKIVIKRDPQKYAQSQIINQGSQAKLVKNEANLSLDNLKQSQKSQRSLKQLKQLKSSNKQTQNIHKIAVKSEPKEQTSQKYNKSEHKSQSIKQISLQDLQDFQEFSQRKSSNKNQSSIHNANKSQSESDACSELPDYVDSQNQDNSPASQKQQNRKQQLKQIPKLANKSKDKLFEGSSVWSEQKKQNSFQTNKEDKKYINAFKAKPIEKENPQNQKNESQRGSEGPQNKVNSMLDFFDQVNDKIDFGEISHNLIDMENRVHNDSF